jgi:mRNA interferase RelE/StbE
VPYKFQIYDKTKKSFLKLDKQIQVKILKYFLNQDLLNNPQIFGKALIGNKKGIWRYRVGDYRILCKIEDKELIILAIEICHRRDVYEDKA